MAQTQVNVEIGSHVAPGLRQSAEKKPKEIRLSISIILPARTEFLRTTILERALQAELTDHLGYEKHDPAGHHRGNTRNGKSQKTLQGDFGELELQTPKL